MFTSDQFRRAQAQHLTHPAALVDDHTACTKCHDLSSDVEDGLCVGCRVAPATTVTHAAVVPCGCLDAYVVPVPGCTEGRVVATLRERTPPHAMVCPTAFAEGATQAEAVERALGALRTALTMPPRAE